MRCFDALSLGQFLCVFLDFFGNSINDRKQNFRPEAARTRVFLVVKKEGNFKFLKKVEFFDGGNVDEKRFEKI